MSSKRNLYPFSLSASAHKSTTKKNASRGRAAFSFKFKPNTYSIEIDNQDQVFKSGLRRKSFTGETPHPILRQLSAVSVPAERTEEEDSGDDESISKFGITQPEHVDNRENCVPNQHAESNTFGSTQLAPVDSDKTDLPKRCDKDIAQPEITYLFSSFDEQLSFKLGTPSHIYMASEGMFASNQFLDKNLEVVKTDLKDAKEKNIPKDQEEEMKKQDEFMRENYSLHRFYIIPDGNCLYRAVAQAILLDQMQHMILRQMTVDHIREHKNEFRDIIEGDLDQFLVAARLEGEWAGYPEILALSRLLDININITTGGTPSNPNVHLRLHYFENPESNHKIGLGTSSPEKKTVEYTQRKSIWLSWMGNGHYDTFIDKCLDNPAYETWCHSRESTIESDAAMANQIYMDDANRQYADENIQRPADNCTTSAIEENLGLYSASNKGEQFGAVDSDVIDPAHNHVSFVPWPPVDASEVPPPYSAVADTRTESDAGLARTTRSEEVGNVGQ